MRRHNRRFDIKSAVKLQEVRNMMRAFGSTAAAQLGERDFLDPELIKIALSYKVERRQRIRRSIDRPALTRTTSHKSETNDGA